MSLMLTTCLNSNEVSIIDAIDAAKKIVNVIEVVLLMLTTLPAIS